MVSMVVSVSQATSVPALSHEVMGRTARSVVSLSDTLMDSKDTRQFVCDEKRSRSLRFESSVDFANLRRLFFQAFGEEKPVARR